MSMFKVGDRYRTRRVLMLLNNPNYEVVESASMPAAIPKGDTATMIDTGAGKDEFVLVLDEAQGSGFKVRVKKVVFGNDWEKIGA
ncbi:hypothetical protein ACVWXL_005756 [Bradyrhizobium sp. GM22.5]